MHRNARTFVEKNHVLQKAAAFRSTPRNIAASTSECQQTKNRYLSCWEEQARLKSQAVHHFFWQKKDPMAKKMRRPTRNTRKCFDVLAISTLTLLSTRRKHAVFWFSNFQNSNLIRSFPLERIFSLLRRDPWRRERVHEFTIFEKRFQSSDWHQSTRKY